MAKTVKAPAPAGKAASKVADRRIYGTDAFGRRVLVAAEGQRIPDGYEVEGQARSAPSDDHARKGPEETQAEPKPRAGRGK
jgi:hypothetical protein